MDILGTVQNKTHITLFDLADKLVLVGVVVVVVVVIIFGVEEEIKVDDDDEEEEEEFIEDISIGCAGGVIVKSVESIRITGGGGVNKLVVIVVVEVRSMGDDTVSR